MHINHIWEVWQPSDVPLDWNRGNRFPICKKGNEEEVRSYRQVSLSSVPGKTMEQILQEAMPRSCTWARAISSTSTGRWGMDGGEGLQGIIDGQKFNMPWPCAGPQKPPVPWADPPAWAAGGLEWDELEGPLQSKAFHGFVTQSTYTTCITKLDRIWEWMCFCLTCIFMEKKTDSDEKTHDRVWIFISLKRKTSSSCTSWDFCRYSEEFGSWILLALTQESPTPTQADLF